MKRCSDKLETLKVKAAIVHYFRFNWKHDIVCTEFDYGSADILSITNKGDAIFEVECKVSLADLKRESKKWKHEHGFLQLADAKPCYFFYLGVPEYLIDQAKIICQENFPYAGLMEVKDQEFNAYGPSGVRIIIEAHPCFIPRHLRNELTKRAIRCMANNICSLYGQVITAKTKLTPLKLL